MSSSSFSLRSSNQRRAAGVREFIQGVVGLISLYEADATRQIVKPRVCAQWIEHWLDVQHDQDKLSFIEGLIKKRERLPLVAERAVDCRHDRRRQEASVRVS